MILNITQTKTNFDMEWEISNIAGDNYAIAKAPFERGSFSVLIQYANDDRVNTMTFNPADTRWGSSLTDRMSFKLFESEQLVGKLVGKTKKVGFLKSYPYYEFSYKGRLFYGYEVGLGKNGLFLCIYENESLIAIVDKKLRVINYKDAYTAYIDDEKYANVVVAFILYYDTATYGDLMDISLISIKEKYVNTVQKELLGKYDPMFIEKIKQK